jgi:hypothetical protein
MQATISLHSTSSAEGDNARLCVAANSLRRGADVIQRAERDEEENDDQQPARPDCHQQDFGVERSRSERLRRSVGRLRPPAMARGDGVAVVTVDTTESPL